MSNASKPPAYPLAPFFTSAPEHKQKPTAEKIELNKQYGKFPTGPKSYPEPIVRAISDLTDGLIIARAADVIERKTNVPLEVKGLKAAMMRVQKRVSDITAKARALDEVGARLEGGLDDVSKQITGHADDFEFGANTLANFTEQSGQSEE